MVKIRLTKSELKKQKESLKRFRRYLPMLQLKKKQLQLEMLRVHQAIKEVSQETEDLRNSIIPWVDVFAEEVPLQELCIVEEIRIKEGNVAGIDLPAFLGVDFIEKPYDLLLTPLWVDRAIEDLKRMINLKAKLSVYHKELDILKNELRIATQRVNLFEKVKIPEACENIRIVQIYLGELQTAEVVRGKIAKAKIERRRSLS